MLDNFCPVGKTRQGRRSNMLRSLMIFEKDICVAASKNWSFLLDLEFKQVLGIRFEQMLNRIAPKLVSKAKRVGRQEDVKSILIKKVCIKNVTYELIIYEVQGKVYVEIAGLNLKRKAVCKKLSKLHKKLKNKLQLGLEPQKALHRYGSKILQALHAQGIIYKQKEKLIHFGNFTSENVVTNPDQLFSKFQKYKESTNNADADLYRTDQFGGLEAVMISTREDCSMYVFKALNCCPEIRNNMETQVSSKDSSVDSSVPKNASFLQPKESTIDDKQQKWARWELRFLKKLLKTLGKYLAKDRLEHTVLKPNADQLNVVQHDRAYFLKHDLKNPLTTITLAAQMLMQNKNIPEKFVDKSLHNILESSRLLSEMIDDMYKKE
ncbi:histidine kinase dimerization/phospho-acceptor domain-containing protein [Chryseobacterium sp. KBW03]|uniref:histidine kinase dimerization/phospho-acceptor domain-containing protein n=1 Tax=Chryseobacterium sp. KBW03 TaxID=2153362 RepID=UPI000F591FAC|nr:histidine kinase dimerization/phospho-acceptor domain-containing protein [Chryseobacterium sp. KBW03]